MGSVGEINAPNTKAYRQGKADAEPAKRQVQHPAGHQAGQDR